jgi:hypothetical protein
MKILIICLLAAALVLNPVKEQVRTAQATASHNEAQAKYGVVIEK